MGPELSEFLDSIVSNEITHVKMQNLDHHERCDNTGECIGGNRKYLQVTTDISLYVISVNYT